MSAPDLWAQVAAWRARAEADLEAQVRADVEACAGWTFEGRRADGLWLACRGNESVHAPTAAELVLAVRRAVGHRPPGLPRQGELL